MENNFERYFFEAKKRKIHNNTLSLVRSDDNDLMGFYFDSKWYMGPSVALDHEIAYAFDMLYVFVGQDPEHDKDLKGELSFTISGHEYVTDKTCMILVPKNTPHGPIKVNRVDQPFFSYIGGAAREAVPESEARWVRPDEATFSFSKYVLHGNGIDMNEAEHEVLRLHDEKGQLLAGFDGVFYGKFRWFKVTTPEEFIFAAESHYHSQPEMLNFFSTDPEDPYNLGAVCEMGMLDDTFILDQTTTIFAPMNQPHCPLKIKKVTRPFMFFTLMPDCKNYVCE